MHSIKVWRGREDGKLFAIEACGCMINIKTVQIMALMTLVVVVAAALNSVLFAATSEIPFRTSFPIYLLVATLGAVAEIFILRSRGK